MNFTFSCVILSKFPSFCFLPNKKGRLSAAFLRFLHFTFFDKIISSHFFYSFCTTKNRTPRLHHAVPLGDDAVYPRGTTDFVSCILPFHIILSTKYRCKRLSAVSSGWKAVAS